MRGIDLVLQNGSIGETYNISGNEEHPNLVIVETVCSCIDCAFAESPQLITRFPDSPAPKGLAMSSLIEFVKDRPVHDRRYAIDARKIEQQLGFPPSHSFQDGLGKTVRWILSNEDWWRSVLDESYRDWIELHCAGE